MRKFIVFAFIAILYQSLCGAENTSDDGITTFDDKVTFSMPGGIYQDVNQVKLQNIISKNSIYYTLNGNSPTTESIQYNGEVLNLTNALCSEANISQIQISPADLYKPPTTDIPKCIVIRAASFDEYGNRTSEVVTNSFFIKKLGIDHLALPIVSISAEHNDLFDYYTGILVPGQYFHPDYPDWSGNYYQRGTEWERQVFVEYYEPSNNQGFRQVCGLRAHGNYGRRLPQKFLAFYAREEYGKSKFSYKIFPENPLESYKRLVLKPFSTSWSTSGIDDYICNKIAANLNIDFISSKPVILYINGEYWGIYYIQEKIDNRYIEDRFGIDKDSVDVIDNWYGFPAEGSGDNFIALYDFVKNNDFTVDSNYSALENWIDIENFIDYQIFEIFIANLDWPLNNMKCWRERKENAKFRWIFNDGDAALIERNYTGFAQALNDKYDGWSSNPQATLFLRKLMERESFQAQFFDRLSQLVATEFQYDVTKTYYDEVIADISNELPNQILRFSFPESFLKWADTTYALETFLMYRTCEIAAQCRDYFHISLNQGNSLVGNDCFGSDTTIINSNVYPNPNSGNFNYSFCSNISSHGKVRLYNILGEMLYESSCEIKEGHNELNFELANLTKGVVVINCVLDNGSSVINAFVVK
jgi:hypothetical protein